MLIIDDKDFLMGSGTIASPSIIIYHDTDLVIAPMAIVRNVAYPLGVFGRQYDYEVSGTVSNITDFVCL
jgi:hypothetical protein